MNQKKNMEGIPSPQEIYKSLMKKYAKTISRLEQANDLLRRENYILQEKLDSKYQLGQDESTLAFNVFNELLDINNRIEGLMAKIAKYYDINDYQIDDDYETIDSVLAEDDYESVQERVLSEDEQPWPC